MSPSLRDSCLGRILAGFLMLCTALNVVSVESTAPAPASINRICLNMMMKNEIKDLPKMLPAIAPHLSGWVVCDTGSTDGSVEMVESFFSEKGLSGHMAHHNWTDNFSRNRNMCLDEGVKFSKEAAPEGQTEACDYLMFLDADHFLVLKDDSLNLKTMPLGDVVYYMAERGTGDGIAEYVNIRLASTRKPWRWQGAVHEVVDLADGHVRSENTQTIPGMFFLHDASGGSDGKRFIRDAKILEQSVAEEPDNARAHFYLGQTYFSLQRWPDALRQYKKRATMTNGWIEENFVSALNYADILKHMYAANKSLEEFVYDDLSSWSKDLWGKDAVSTIIRAFYAAHEILPYRAEPLHRIAYAHRVWRKDYRSCFNVASMAFALPPPPSHALFIEGSTYKFDILDEICVCGYYADQMERGLSACQELERRLVDAKNDIAPAPSFTDRMLNRTRDSISWYGRALGREVHNLDTVDERREKAEAKAKADAPEAASPPSAQVNTALGTCSNYGNGTEGGGSCSM